MFENRKLIGINQIIEEEEIYPRQNYYWVVSLQYSDAMKTGAEFPPIVVGKFENKFYLIDGKHRLEAYKNLKHDSVDVEIINVNSKAQILEEAIKRNIIQGKQLSAGDKEKAIKNLRLMDYQDEKIAELLMMPLKTLKNFRVNKISNAITKEPIITEKEEISLMTQSIQKAQDKRPQLIIGGMIGFLDNPNIKKSQKLKYKKELKLIYEKLKELFEE